MMMIMIAMMMMMLMWKFTYLTGEVSLTPHTAIILTQWLIILDTNPPEKFWKQCYSIISITGTSRLGIRIKRGKSSLHNSDKPVELDSFASVAEPKFIGSGLDSISWQGYFVGKKTKKYCWIRATIYAPHSFVQFLSLFRFLTNNLGLGLF